MTARCCKDRILPLENRTCSAARPTRQYTKHQQSCSLPPAQVQRQKQPGTPSDACHQQRGPRRLSQTTAQLTGGLLESRCLWRKRPWGESASGSTCRHRFRIFPGTCFDSHQPMSKHPSPAADTPSLGRRGGQLRPPAIHELRKRKRIH